MLNVNNLCAIRDNRTLFEKLNFTLRPEEITLIDGVNGAGKTTLLRIVAGLSLPDNGEILWRKKSILTTKNSYHNELLYISHLSGLKSILTAFENLKFYQLASGKNTDDNAIWQALENVGLIGCEDVAVMQLSAGQQRRVALARLYLTDALLWILDEPLTAIDKNGVNNLVALFNAKTEKGGIILLTTHQEITPQLSCCLQKITLTCKEQ